MFVCAAIGAQGPSSDSVVLRQVGFIPQVLESGVLPEGSMMLVDAGYPNTRHCLSPYRGVRYHLKEFGQARDRPANAKEYYNLWHAKIRNCVERAFGILKIRFEILTRAMRGDLNFCLDAIFACFLLHNFLARHGSQLTEAEVESLQEAIEAARSQNPEDYELEEDQDNYRDAFSSACYQDYIEILRGRGIE